MENCSFTSFPHADCCSELIFLVREFIEICFLRRILPFCTLTLIVMRNSHLLGARFIYSGKNMNEMVS